MKDFIEIVLTREEVRVLLQLLSTPQQDPLLEEARKQLFDFLYDMYFQPIFDDEIDEWDRGEEECQENSIS